MTKLDKIKYSFLKELEENENRIVEGKEIVIPTRENYNLNDEAYGNLILYLENEGYITAQYARAKDIPVIVISANIISSYIRWILYMMKVSNKYRENLWNNIKNLKNLLSENGLIFKSYLIIP